MENKILLLKNKSKIGYNTNNFLSTKLISGEKMIPSDQIIDTISSITVYNSERSNCNNLRITLSINPICSNVLFNNVSEIIKNEGSYYVKCLNYGEEFGNIRKESDFKNVLFKKNPTEYFLNTSNALRDTQLSNISNGFVYHCGIDIFNNHFLRSKTFKTICPITQKNGESDDFNTLSDKMRDYNGNQILGYSDKEDSLMYKNIPLHVYLADDIISYKDSVKLNLKENNGWFGFNNAGKLRIHSNEFNYDWFNVINSKRTCDFIEMYPTKDLFYFDPKYNKYKNRVEKNWNYCLTYPSSSTTKDITFIDVDSNGETSLRAIYFDDTLKSSNGLDCIKIFSVSKHGLKKDDIVNLYLRRENGNRELVLKNANVIEIVDDYVFIVFSDGVKLSKKWINLDDNYENSSISDDVVSISDDDNTDISDDKKILYYNGNKYYILDDLKVNVDDNAQSLSYSRVSDGSEVKYYVRIFSKIPNFKFSKFKNTKDNLKDLNIIKEYQRIDYDFESHVGKLGFSKNIYNDNISEVVFEDDIDLSNLTDNLGRPLTSIYFTILKNNEGYREWYGKYGDIKIDSDNIEYSHCFGKLNCAFNLSKESNPNNLFNDVTLINNVKYDGNKYNGININYINENRDRKIDFDEIQYNKYRNYHGDINFYGDLCCYSDSLCEEQIIQDIDFRFNTAQREANEKFSSCDFFNKIEYDEIIKDDYDYSQEMTTDSFKIKTTTIGGYAKNSAALRCEGYFYKPHYEIKIHSFSDNIYSSYPFFIKVKEISLVGDNFNVTTISNHGLSNGELIYIYSKKENKLYNGKVFTNNERINQRKFSIILNDSLFLNKKDFTYFIIPSTIPSYSNFMYDGSCRFIWREVIKNGFGDENTEIYPFANNAFYINKNINLFVRRQNYENLNELSSVHYPYDVDVKKEKKHNKDNYFNNEEIKC